MILKKIDFNEISLPFGVGNLPESSMSLFLIFEGFILLGLALILFDQLAPHEINFTKKNKSLSRSFIVVKVYKSVVIFCEKYATKLQTATGDDLFPQVTHVSDVKQVLELMKHNAQDLRESQIRAILLLRELGNNPFLHGKENPYKEIEKFVMQGKEHVADPDYYIDTIEALIPKPPKPVIMAQDGKPVQQGRKC